MAYASNVIKQANHAVDFRTTPKNILFSSVGGGASHSTWVIRILDQLHNRGHNVFFATANHQLRFADGHPHIKTSSIGPSHFKQIPRIAHGLRMPASFDFAKQYRSNTLREYKTTMLAKKLPKMQNSHLSLLWS
ncbi:hypothetical protein K492DRAFT_201138 [Lichtheimia hyalospora FSU 10163]|nr:hypothetical protein K492DRAFT_201138 [Lichtheimia hyalospora FSU 10163]